MNRFATILATSLLAVLLVSARADSIEVKSKAKPTASPAAGDTSTVAVPTGTAVAPHERGAVPESAATPAVKGQAAESGPKDRSSKRTLLERLKRKVREAQKDEQQKYDHLIDANNDGVDDRIEAVPPAAGSAKPVERKPRIDSTRKTPPK